MAQAEREAKKAQLLLGPTKVIGQLRARVDNQRGGCFAEVPSLGIKELPIPLEVRADHPELLDEGLWAEITVSQREGEKGNAMVLDHLAPIGAKLSLDRVVELRSAMTTRQWMAFMVASAGLSPAVLEPQTRMWYLSRLIPIVERNCVMIELGPPGNGKTTTLTNLTRNKWLSQAKLSVPLLYWNRKTSEPGAILRHDVVVVDDCQNATFVDLDEFLGVTRDFLGGENGSFTVGEEHFSHASFVCMGNIPTKDARPQHEELIRREHFRERYEFFGDVAFLDRVNGIIPGWEIPSVPENATPSCLCLQTGVMMDLLRSMREIDGQRLIRQIVAVPASVRKRDSTSFYRTSSGYLKLLFPHLLLGAEPKAQEIVDLIELCIEPARALRTTVNHELLRKNPGGPYPRVLPEFPLRIPESGTT